MSDYLESLVARTLQPAEQVRPRVGSRFEASGLGEGLAERIEVAEPVVEDGPEPAPRPEAAGEAPTPVRPPGALAPALRNRAAEAGDAALPAEPEDRRVTESAVPVPGTTAAGRVGPATASAPPAIAPRSAAPVSAAAADGDRRSPRQVAAPAPNVAATSAPGPSVPAPNLAAPSVPARNAAASIVPAPLPGAPARGVGTAPRPAAADTAARSLPGPRPVPREMTVEPAGIDDVRRRSAAATAATPRRSSAAPPRPAAAIEPAATAIRPAAATAIRPAAATAIRPAAPGVEPGRRDTGAAPAIRVTIGRVEVRAQAPVPPPAPDPVRLRQPAVSLDAYLKRRDAGRR